jgi:hypothetical protein
VGAINLPGFTATVTGANKRVHVEARFMESGLTVDASLEFAKKVVQYAPFIKAAVFNANGKAGIEAAKIEIEKAIKTAGG